MGTNVCCQSWKKENAFENEKLICPISANASFRSRLCIYITRRRNPGIVESNN